MFWRLVEGVPDKYLRYVFEICVYQCYTPITRSCIIRASVSGFTRNLWGTPSFFEAHLPIHALMKDYLHHAKTHQIDVIHRERMVCINSFGTENKDPQQLMIMRQLIKLDRLKKWYMHWVWVLVFHPPLWIPLWDVYIYLRRSGSCVYISHVYTNYKHLHCVGNASDHWFCNFPYAVSPPLSLTVGFASVGWMSLKNGVITCCVLSILSLLRAEAPHLKSA